MIRPAVPEDIYRLVEMARAFWAETGWGDRAEFDVESFAFTAGTLMDRGVLLVSVADDGNVVGMAGAGLAQAWWNRNVLTAQEIFWYCEKGHRKGLGRQLMTNLEAAVASLGVKLFSMSAEEGLRSKALGRLYRQRGYIPSEMLFWKELSGVAQ